MYDRHDSQYITLADIRQFVIGREDFTVTDKKSRADITDNVLLQVLLEQQQSSGNVLGRDFLLQTIRTHATPPKGGNGELPQPVAARWTRRLALTS
jgi:polyhydroxyalkanoate synthesis repressor PhaR